MLQLPENGDQMKRPSKQSLSAERLATSEIKLRVQTDVDGTGIVEILGADVEHPVVLHLPAPVADAARREVELASRIQNPADELARNYEEWENATNEDVKFWGKDI